MRIIKRIYWWLASQICGLIGWCFYSGGKVKGIALTLNAKSYTYWCRYYIGGMKGE